MTTELWWTSMDRHAQLPMGEYETKAEAVAAIPTMTALLLDRCHDAAGRAGIRAGTWSLSAPRGRTRAEWDAAWDTHTTGALDIDVWGDVRDIAEGAGDAMALSLDDAMACAEVAWIVARDAAWEDAADTDWDGADVDAAAMAAIAPIRRAARASVRARRDA